MLQQDLIGKTIGGRYQIEALLGQGGMSAVYRATDPNLRRTVAIKLIHPHLSTDPNFVGRFKEEAAAVARLRHPNIVQVHDFNVDGETYFMVMEYLVGETLQARLKRLNASGRQMSFSEAVSICTQICEAAGYAHDHELIHRDIKPANIMLDVHNQAILMDFGIVKIIGGEYHTATGATVGTAMYMSPEQIRSERIDDCADIYSLGVALYEMISGRPPYQADSALTLMMMVLNDPLPDLRELRADVPDALLAVVSQALAKERSERFQSMAEMAAALRQSQTKTTVTAPASTIAEDKQASPATPPFTLSPVSSTLQDRLPEPVQEGFPPSQSPGPITAAPDALHQDMPISTTAAEQEKSAESVPAPRQTSELKTPPTVRRVSGRSILLIAGILVLLAGIAAILFYVSARQPPALVLAPVSYSPTLLDAQNAQNVVSLGKWNLNSYIVDLAFSPDGSLLGTANDRDWVRISKYRFYTALWGVETANLQKYLLGHTQWVSSVAFSPDGKRFVSASDDYSLLVWQLPAGSLERKIVTTIGGMTSVDFSPTNLLIAAGSWDGSVGLWQVSNGNLLRTLKEGESSIKDVQFSPDGSLLAASSDDSSIRLWKVSDGSLSQTLRGHTAAVPRLAFSLDGSLLASASEDHSIRVWRMGDGTLLNTLSGHSEVVKDVAFSKDGSLLASGSEDGTLRLWQVDSGQLLRTFSGENGILSLAFSPNGFYLISGAANGDLQFWGISEAIPLETQAVPDTP